MFYIIIFYIFMLSKALYSSTTNNSIQSSWEDLGKIEQFDNIDEIEKKIIENQSKKIISSKDLMEEIRTIYNDYNCAFHAKLHKKKNNDDDDDGFNSEEEKLSFLSKKINRAEKNLQILVNILHSPKNIVIPREVMKKENIDRKDNNFDIIQEDTLYNILIKAEQINSAIITRYKETIFQYSSSKSSLSTSPNINKDNLIFEKNNTKQKARVRAYLASLESTPQENNSLGSSENNIFALRSKNKKACFSLPPETDKTAIFQPSPRLDSRYLSCESIDETIAMIPQKNNSAYESSDENDDLR